MVRHKMNQPGKSLGVIGLGGLDHMAVQFSKVFGLNVTIFSTSISKKEEALSQLGADNFVVSSDRNQMKVKIHKVSYLITCNNRKNSGNDGLSYRFSIYRLLFAM